jgi:hypothetical protein
VGIFRTHHLLDQRRCVDSSSRQPSPCVTDQPMGRDISSLNGAALCNGSEEVFPLVFCLLVLTNIKVYSDIFLYKWNLICSEVFLFVFKYRIGKSLFCLFVRPHISYLLLYFSGQCMRKWQFLKSKIKFFNLGQFYRRLSRKMSNKPIY